MLIEALEVPETIGKTFNVKKYRKESILEQFNPQVYVHKHFKTQKPILCPTAWTSGVIYRYPPQGFMTMFISGCL